MPLEQTNMVATYPLVLIIMRNAYSMIDPRSQTSKLEQHKPFLVTPLGWSMALGFTDFHPHFSCICSGSWLAHGPTKIVEPLPLW